MHISSNALISIFFCIYIGLPGLTGEATASSDTTLYSQRSSAPLMLMSGMMMASSDPDLLIPLAWLKAFFHDWWTPPVEDYQPIEFYNEFETFPHRLQRLVTQYPDKDMDEIWQMALDEEKPLCSNQKPESFFDESIRAGEAVEKSEPLILFAPEFYQAAYSIKGIILIPRDNGDGSEQEDSGSQEATSDDEEAEEYASTAREDNEGGSAEAAAATVPPEVVSCYRIITHPKTGVTFALPKDLPAADSELVTSAIELYDDESQRKHLCSGSFGEVEYLSCQETFFAFKKSRGLTETPENTPNKKYLDRAARDNLNELLMLTELKHDNILQILAVIPEPRADGRQSWILVSKWMGNSLWQHLYDLPDREKVVTLNGFMFAIDIVSAVGYLHKKGIVHSDLKTKNLVVHKAHGYRLILLDFGVALRLDEKGKADAMSGSTLTLAPELRVGPEQVEGIFTPACDVFSIASILGRLAMCDLASSKRVIYEGHVFSEYDYFCSFAKRQLAEYIAKSYSDSYRCLEMYNSGILPEKGHIEPEFFSAPAITIIQYIATMMARPDPHKRLTLEMADYLLGEYRSHHLQLQHQHDNESEKTSEEEPE